MTETVHILVPVHNRAELTRRFLRCVRQQSYRPTRVIVIDDGSSDGTAAIVSSEFPEATVLHGSGHWWWAGSLQEGFNLLRRQGPPDTDVILIANDDTTFDADFVARAVEFLRAHDNTLLGSQHRDPATGSITQSGIEADVRRLVFRIAARDSGINCLSTRGLFLRWGDMLRIGGFHRYLLPHYWSDYEYTMRAHRRGFACRTDRSVALTARLDTTGDRDLDRLVGWTFVRRFFSIRSPLNPIHRTAFVLLASPGIWKLMNLLNVWGRALARLVWQGVARKPFPRERMTMAATPSERE